MKLRRKDRKSSLFFVCFGTFVVISAYRFGLGTLSSPGPGLFPFGGGLLMIFLALSIYCQALIQSEEGEKELIQIGNLRIFLLIICLTLYALSFRKAGFILTNFLLLTFLFQFLERRSWLVYTLVSVITIFIFYIFFVVWLNVPLPKGFIGF